MKVIESILEPTNGYINSFTRNTVEGWWEIEIGLPKAWVFSENNEISCEIIFENEFGKLVKIAPKKNSKVVIDDLIAFVGIIMETNKKIAQKELEFKKLMEEMRDGLEAKAKEFYKELDDLKETSFRQLSEDFASDIEKEKKERKKRATKNEVLAGTNGTTETVSNEQS